MALTENSPSRTSRNVFGFASRSKAVRERSMEEIDRQLAEVLPARITLQAAVDAAALAVTNAGAAAADLAEAQLSDLEAKLTRTDKTIERLQGARRERERELNAQAAERIERTNRDRDDRIRAALTDAATKTNKALDDAKVVALSFAEAQKAVAAAVAALPPNDPRFRRVPVFNLSTLFEGEFTRVAPADPDSRIGLRVVVPGGNLALIAAGIPLRPGKETVAAWVASINGELKP